MRAEFKELELVDNNVGRKVVVDGDEVYAHVEFMQQLRKKARACSDQNLMVMQGITKLPQQLREALSPEHVDFKTWEELVDTIVALSPARIELADEALATKEKIHSLFSSSPGPAALQQMYANLQPQVLYQSLSPYYTAARLQPTQTLWSPLRTPMSQGVSPVDLYGEIMPKTSKEVKLEHEDTKEGWQSYAKAIDDWNEKWGTDAQPIPSRLYPIHPNTPPIGDLCCWNCGSKDHMAGNCRTDHSQYLPEKEREWRRQQQGGP